MKTGYLYFVKDEFYDKFGKYGLLGNKESENDALHNRPCCYLFHLEYGENIFWMIPVSFRIEKYEKEYKKSIDKSLMAELSAKARKKIRYNFNGRKFGMSDIVSIFRELEEEED